MRTFIYICILCFNISCNSIQDFVEQYKEIYSLELKNTEQLILSHITKEDSTFNKRKCVTDCYVKYIGVRELTGKNDGVEIEMFLLSVNLSSGYAWCAAFVAFCLTQCEVQHTINAWSPTAHNSNDIVYFRSNFKREPLPGDITTFYYEKLKRIGHAGFYHKRKNDKMYYGVEGNTGGGVDEEGNPIREGDGVYTIIRSFNTTHSITNWIY